MAWHDTDSFWLDFHEVMFHQRRWDQAEEEVGGVVALTGLTAPKRVLDMCCGPGRHSLAMARRGFSVKGVDRTRAYIEEAQSKTGDCDAVFEVGDAREFCEPQTYDGATCLYTSFGYFETQEEDVALLRNVCDSLKPGGSFVLDMHGKEITARAFKERSWEILEDGSKLLEARSVGPDWAWIENVWTVIKDDVQKEMAFRVRLYSGVELRKALSAAGFSTVELYGDWDGAAYDARARRLIGVARK